MLIENRIIPYFVLDTDSIFRALEKINANNKRIVFVVDADGQLVGALSDGDFRRWLTATPDFQLTVPVSEIMHTRVTSKHCKASRREIELIFSSKIDVVPLVDDCFRLVSIASRTEQGLVIGGCSITEKSPTFIIAEIGNNHNGNPVLAKRLVDEAVLAGADCVKFQMRDMSSLYKNSKEVNHADDLGAQYTQDLLHKFQLPSDVMVELFDYVKEKGAIPLCTPWDCNSLLKLEKYGMEAYKVASADFTNHSLLTDLIATRKPLICSTGMCSEVEIQKSVELLRANGCEFILLHCNSTYPTPLKDVNLLYLERLKEIAGHGSFVGYSGHERGINIPVAAVALGAKVIEKHFTLDRDMEGNDHKVSLLPSQFKDMVIAIRQLEQALGHSEERVITQGELINRESLAKSLVVNCDLKKGSIITREMIEIKSPGQGLQPMYLEDLLGKTARRNLKAGDYFYEADLKAETISPRKYNFNRPFGIPVRYHDYNYLKNMSNFDFIEFHMSYQDMELDVDRYIDSDQTIGFVLHSPELFSKDHIMDLASKNREYRGRSVFELGRVCNITRNINKNFPQTISPMVVINAGGFDTKGFLPKEKRPSMYGRVAESLAEVDDSGVEIVIQTMPPFPWHFGGQSFHNLFVDPEEIVLFCKTYGYRICYDVSHSMMACNYYKWDFSYFTQKVGPYIAHLHVVDAKGVDGEGCQIGSGDIDFTKLGLDLDTYAPNIQFIPEIWQGHKNNGEGFWAALDFLEGKL
jgi:N-acetylneuraminate synthase